VAAKGTALAGAAVALLFLRSAIKGTSLLGNVQDLIQGKKPSDAQSEPIQRGQSAAGGSGIPGSGDNSAHTKSAAHNQALAKLLLAPLGFTTGNNWQALLELWNRESGWSNTAENSGSGAFGIAQALPSSKYPLAGRPVSAGGTCDAATQIRWGGRYIKDRYGTPVKALAHEDAFGWY
jgi:hypothetical protein